MPNDSMRSRGADDRAPGTGLSPDDRVAIDQLFARCAWALDTADTSALADLFTADARIEDTAGAFLFEPPDAASRFAKSLIRDPSFPGRQHWIGQTVLTPEGDAWTARSFGMAPHLHSSTGTNFLAWLGYYEDTLVKQEGQWRFKVRRFIPWKGSVLGGFPRFPPQRADEGA